MLHYSLVFLVIALIAAFLGFGGVAGAAAGIAKILFVVFLVVWLVTSPDFPSIDLACAAARRHCSPKRLRGLVHWSDMKIRATLRSTHFRHSFVCSPGLQPGCATEESKDGSE